MADYLVQDTELTGVANHIRAKGGTSELLVWPDEYEDAIDAIQTGGILQSKSVTPTESAQTVTPDTGYDGLSQVSVGAISKTYVGSDVPRESSSNLTASGATVTAPAGYYSTAATKTIDSGSTTQNAPTVNSSTGLVTATATVTAGYQGASTKSNTLQLTIQAAQTITPGTTNKTIAAGKYLTGTQTIAGDSNLVAANIAEGVSIFGVTGTHSGGGEGGGGGGGGSVSANAVNFRDYDGTIVHSYSAADFAALTAMPNNPSHDGLTAQGWNWSLADAKAYVAKYGRLEIGQMYITNDGKTRVYIHLEKGRTSPRLGVCPNGTVDVDWGDGTAHTKLTGTSTSTVKWTSNHAYAAPGDYIIKLTVTGEMGFYGNDSTNQDAGLLRYTSSADSRNHVYQNAIRKVEIGNGVTKLNYAFNSCYNLVNVTIPNGITSIGTYAFHVCYQLVSVTIPNSVKSISNGAFSQCLCLVSITIPNSVTSINNSAFSYCHGLANVTIPDSVTSIGTSMFQECYNLVNVTIPDSVTSIGNNMFYYCYSLVNVTIPDSVTSIGGSVFSYCYSLANVTIPDSVTSIGGNAFIYCYGVAEYHLAPTTPPTLSSTGAFSGIPADCIIYVPYSADHSILEAYKTATNWSTYASKMQEETI